MLNLGVHISSKGGIYQAIDRAKALGCSTFQIFARNPQAFRKEDILDSDTELFKKKIKEANINPVVIHIPYTLNLATVKKKFHKITIREFSQDLKEADKLEADYLVTHMGSYKGGAESEGIKNVVSALRQILKDTNPIKTKILLENTAGSGSWLGHNFFHFRTVLEGLSWDKRIGVCLDTAHAWAAGYRIDNRRGIYILLKEIEKNIGLDRVLLVHLNDTKQTLASKIDRHCAIASGCIGKKGMYNILHNKFLKHLPFILETPKKDERDDLNNLRRVRKIYEYKL